MAAAKPKRAKKSGGGAPTRRLLLTFVPFTDPTSEQCHEARSAIQAIPGVRVLGEIPGTIQIEVDEMHASELQARMASLDAWKLAEESVAQMPETRGLDTKSG